MKVATSSSSSWKSQASVCEGGSLQAIRPSKRVRQHHHQQRAGVVAKAASPASAASGSIFFQKVVSLRAYPRGCHVVTSEVLDHIADDLLQFQTGLAHLFILHTSASLTINENASPDVPLDLNDALDSIAPEGSHYRHLDEGRDDMPAHIKSSLMGAGLTLPIANGRFLLGVWQGIYLNEHRDYGGSRKIAITIQGQPKH